MFDLPLALDRAISLSIPDSESMSQEIILRSQKTSFVEKEIINTTKTEHNNSHGNSHSNSVSHSARNSVAITGHLRSTTVTNYTHNNSSFNTIYANRSRTMSTTALDTVKSNSNSYSCSNYTRNSYPLTKKDASNKISSQSSSKISTGKAGNFDFLIVFIALVAIVTHGHSNNYCNSYYFSIIVTVIVDVIVNALVTVLVTVINRLLLLLLLDF